MFERVITQTIQRISSEVLRDRQSVPLTEILEDERIPTRFKPFFATEVRWWLYNDALARSANKRFDVGHPEVAALLDYLEQVMFRHARFEHDEFVSTLDGAVKLTFNYLCRPQTTLKWYIFRGQPVKPLSEVMLRFESFLDYEYIGNVFAEWVERKVRERATFEAISATEFERIIRRIDDQILLSCTVDELLALLDPIFDFIGEGEGRVVPLDALIIFFDDKNIARLVDHLERYRETDPLISRARLVAVVEELLTSAEENPEADFSSVYQNDELDDIVQRHLEAEGKLSSQHAQAASTGSTGSPSDDPSIAATPEHEIAGHEATTSSISDAETAQDAALEVADVFAVEVSELLAGTERADAAVGEIEDDEEPETERPDRAGIAAAPTPRDAATPTVTPAPNDGRAPTTEAGRTDDAAPVGETSPKGETSPIDEPAPPHVAAPTQAAAPTEDAAPVGETTAIKAAQIAQAAPEQSAPTDAAAPTDETAPIQETASLDEPAGDDRAPIDEHRAANRSAASLPRDVSAASAAELDVREHLNVRGSERDETGGARITDAASVEDVVSTLEQSASVLAPPLPIGLDPMLERKVLKKIFNRDRQAYDEAMTRLSGAATWRQASQVLDELFIRFDVDPYSRTALRFTDSIYTRYVPTSHT